MGSGLGVLPLERAIAAGARLGDIAMALDRFNRPVAMRNLEIAFPELGSGARLEILLRKEKIANETGPIAESFSRRTTVSCAR